MVQKKAQAAGIPFVKMQGLGNDFVLVDVRAWPKTQASKVTAGLARKLCDRRFGVGADQVLVIRKPSKKTSDARMDIFNSDGSVAETCGNGLRAAALYLFRESKSKKKTLSVETVPGVVIAEFKGTAQKPSIRAEMGVPRLGSGFSTQGEGIELSGGSARFFEVSMGNPHAVFFVRDTKTVPLEVDGPCVEMNPRFPDRTNVEFVQVMGMQEIRVRVWERGAGVTLACGSGACASAVAALATGRVKSPVQVHLPGGALTISWAGEGAAVFMEGPAVEVFRGEFLDQ